MERSKDVETAVRGMYEAVRSGDVESIEEMIGETGVVFVGTDADEWWQDDPVALRDAVRQQLEATGGFDFVHEDPICYSDGNVGWFSDRPSMRLPDGTVVPMRQTGVLLRVDGEWRIVQSHLSVAASINERLFADA